MWSVGQGMEALLEPEMAGALAGDCRQPGGHCVSLGHAPKKNYLQNCCTTQQKCTTVSQFKLG
jgi:hypothetical protein